MQYVDSKALAFAGLVATLLASMCASAQVAGEATTAASRGPASMTLPRVVALTSADIDAYLGVSEKFVEKGIRRAGRAFTAGIPGLRVGVTDAGKKAHGMRSHLLQMRSLT